MAMTAKTKLNAARDMLVGKLEAVGVDCSNTETLTALIQKIPTKYVPTSISNLNLIENITTISDINQNEIDDLYPYYFFDRTTIYLKPADGLIYGYAEMDLSYTFEIDGLVFFFDYGSDLHINMELTFTTDSKEEQIISLKKILGKEETDNIDPVVRDIFAVDLGKVLRNSGLVAESDQHVSFIKVRYYLSRQGIEPNPDGDDHWLNIFSANLVKY